MNFARKDLQVSGLQSLDAAVPLADAAHLGDNPAGTFLARHGLAPPLRFGDGQDAVAASWRTWISRWPSGHAGPCPSLALAAAAEGPCSCRRSHGRRRSAAA